MILKTALPAIFILASLVGPAPAFEGKVIENWPLKLKAECVLKAVARKTK